MSSVARNCAVYGSRSLAIILGLVLLLSAIVAIYILPEASSATKVALLLGTGLVYFFAVVAAFTPKGGKLRAGILVLIVLVLAAVVSFIWVHYGLPWVLSLT